MRPPDTALAALARRAEKRHGQRSRGQRREARIRLTGAAGGRLWRGRAESGRALDPGRRRAGPTRGAARRTDKGDIVHSDKGDIVHSESTLSPLVSRCGGAG